MIFIEYNSEIDLKDKKIIGIDETGVGDFFGFVVSCAAIVPKKNLDKIIELGIKDSKQLSDSRILLLCEQIKNLVYYSINYLSPLEYNRLNEKLNANEIKMFSHLKALEKLQSLASNIDYVFIDQYSTLKSIEKYYKKMVLDTNEWELPKIKFDTLLSHKAENIDINVAVASVLARGMFLNLMKKQSKKFGVDLPLGAGPNVKEFAQNLFKNKDEDFKKTISKTHFKMF
ncbi:ribonuclease HIII [Mycoplasmopsis iners]|uniref:ribonuclease HIII n=1 Tax=Mycoplasmopsis iners TaxID=76630 RepID=UPI0004979BCB|nr:ribonuclease HIII [Mycoplasmopsis iners]